MIGPESDVATTGVVPDKMRSLVTVADMALLQHVHTTVGPVCERAS